MTLLMLPAGLVGNSIYTGQVDKCTSCTPTKETPHKNINRVIIEANLIMSAASM